MTTKRLPSLKTYLLIWGALLVLLAANAGSAFLPLGPFNVVVNLAIAVTQTLLVMVFFMHLRGDNALVRLVAVAGFFWLMLLIVLSLSDFLTRYPVPTPW